MQRNKKQIYDLEDRTYTFARAINKYVLNLPKTITNIENGKQLVKAGGSVGANYIEANEALSKKDFKYRIKIAKKEVKESRYWLRLTIPKKQNIKEQERLIREATELMKILGAILSKCS